MKGKLSNFYASKFIDLKDSILFSKTNKFAYQNLTYKASLYNTVFEQPNSIFYKYKDLLLNNCVSIELDKKYHFLPDHLSKDIYGCTELGFLILFLNDITHPINFIKDKVVVLSPDNLKILNEIIEKNKVTIATSKVNPLDVSNLTIKEIYL